MRYPFVQRATDVREGWPGDKPPPASLIHSVLRMQSRRRNTADIADVLGVLESQVARICEVDQNIRHYARERLQSEQRATA